MTRFRLILPNSCLLLVVGNLLLPISPYFCIAFYLAACFVSGVRFNYNLLKKEYLLTVFCFSVLALWLILRTNNSGGLGIHSLTDIHRYPVTLFDYFLFLLVFLFLSIKSFTTSEIKAISWSLLFSSFPIFVAAIVEKYVKLPESNFFYPHEHFAIIKISLGYGSARIASVFVNPNWLGFYCVLALSVAFGLLIQEIKIKNNHIKSKPSIEFNFIKWYLKIFFIIIFLVLLLVMLAWSGAKNALVAFLIILIYFTVVSQLKALRFLGFLLCSSLLISVVDFGFITTLIRKIIPKELWNRLINLSLTNNSFSVRLEYYKCAIELIQERPWLGWGIGTMAQECENRLELAPYRVNHAHNIFLQLAAEIGIPFTLVFSGIIAFIIYVSAKNIFNQNCSDRGDKYIVMGFLLAAISGLIMSCFALAMFHSYRLLCLFCLCLAIPYAKALSGSRTLQQKSNDIDQL